MIHWAKASRIELKAFLKLFAFGLLFMHECASGQNACFRLMDSISNEPIAYCNILPQHGQGFVSNHLGEFCVSVSRNDSIVFEVSNISYETQRFSFSGGTNGSVLYLKSKEYELKPIEINWSKYEFYELGNKYKQIDNYINLWRFCQIGLYIPPLKKGTGIIEKAYIPVKNNCDVKVPFRLHIYRATENMEVAQELLPVNIYCLLSNKNEIIEIDLLKYQVLIPETGVFITVELLSNNKPTELHIGTGNHYGEKYNNMFGMSRAGFRNRKSYKVSSWKPGSFYVEPYPFTNVVGMMGDLPLFKVKVRKIID